MKPLDACRIAVAAFSLEGAARVRADALREAGASVRGLAFGQSLWVELSEAAFDLVVVQAAAPDDLAASAIYQQLRADPRTRSVPALLLTDTVRCSQTDSYCVLGATPASAELVRAAEQLVAAARILREAEARERLWYEELREHLNRLERATRERAELAHELRAVLSAVLGFAANLRDEVAGPLLPDQRSHVAGILDAVERATRLLHRPTGSFVAVRSLSSRPASAPPRVQRSLVNLARLAQELMALFEAVAMRQAVVLSCVADDTVCVWGDALRLKQVVSNLVVNALKYTPKGGQVTVGVAWSGPAAGKGVQGRRAAELTVSDTGPGIPPEHRENIFRRGFRLEQHTGIAGEGIGLSVVREVVLQHGGSVCVEDEPGAGAVFKVTLPQDRRQRDRSAALVVREGERARQLLEQLATYDAEVGPLVTPEEREQFLELATNCRAAFVVGSDDELNALLSHLPDLTAGERK
jgi:signal transduction histidine kinase